MQDQLKQLRSFYGLSQAQFAEKIHIAPGFISNVETGRAHVSDRTIDAICNAFPINRDWLMRGEGGMFLDGAAQNEVDKSTVGLRIREIRKQEGLTQQEFARRIGYSAIQIHSVEKGKVTPTNQFLEKVASEFRVSYEWLLKMSDSRS